MDSPLQFTLTSQRLNKQEQAIFEPDIIQLGLSPLIWTILNGSMEARTKHSEIRLLRAYRKNTLCGVSYIVICRQYGSCLFTNQFIASTINFPAIPIFIWPRSVSATDMINNPGFVSSECSRSGFVSLALSYLQDTFFSGLVVDSSSTRNETAGVRLPFADYGIIDLSDFTTIDTYLDRYKNIQKKRHKFFNKGGAVKIVRGALSEGTQTHLREIHDNIKPLIVTPFQDNYTNMVLQASQTDSKNIIHFLTYLGGGHLVGYHSFAYMKDALYCLSGAFDRRMHSTYHAYENMIIETVKFCLANNISKIFYGPVLNPTKARMMNRFQLCEQSLHSRFSILKKIFPALSNYLNISPRNFKSFIAIEAG